MDNVIYSATALQTFLPMFGMVLFFFVLGGGGLASGIFGRKQALGTRIAMLFAGGILTLAGLGMGVVALRNLNTAQQTAAVRLNDKFVAVDNCGDGGTCERYMLEMQGGEKFYDVQVDRRAYDLARVAGCYELTYYPGGGLLGRSDYPAAYESISAVTRLEAVDPSRCQ